MGEKKGKKDKSKEKRQRDAQQAKAAKQKQDKQQAAPSKHPGKKQPEWTTRGWLIMWTLAIQLLEG